MPGTREPTHDVFDLLDSNVLTNSLKKTPKLKQTPSTMTLHSMAAIITTQP